MSKQTEAIISAILYFEKRNLGITADNLVCELKAALQAAEPTYAGSEQNKNDISILRHYYTHDAVVLNVCDALETSLQRIAELEQENRALKEAK